jgi:hypothetical protein
VLPLASAPLPLPSPFGSLTPKDARLGSGRSSISSAAKRSVVRGVARRCVCACQVCVCGGGVGGWVGGWGAGGRPLTPREPTHKQCAGSQARRVRATTRHTDTRTQTHAHTHTHTPLARANFLPRMCCRTASTLRSMS